MQGITPKVSVCVVTYNHEKYIRECLQSILSQAAEIPIEVIVGDDCSTDDTAKILEEFVERYPDVVKHVRHSKNVGSTENYLIIHKQARGEYVCHCDGDDFWLPGKLKRQVEFMEANPEVVQCWHRQKLVDQESVETGVFPKRFPRLVYGKALQFRDLAHSYGLVGQHSSQMYRRSARSVYARPVPTIDYFFALDIGSGGPSVHLPEILGCYRVVPGGSITQGSSGRNMVDRCLIETVHYYAAKFPELRAAFRANLTVRAMGARAKKRPLWRELNEAVAEYPVSILSTLRSLFIFATHRF